ncbi:MAG: dockerin type I repeat-containing protein, partial [Planctomycetota bacterium]
AAYKRTLSQGLAPAQICDNMTIIEPVDPISGFNCFESADPCNCSFDLSWTNNGTYDSIAVYEAGVLLQTLAGTATSITVDVPGSAEYCIEPMRDGIVGPPVCCTPTCSPSSVNPTPVTILDCLVDAPTCTLTVTWTNESQYSSLRVLVDGTEVLALAGTETSAIVSLGAPGSYEVCVDGTTICGDAVAAACCTVECPREFQRGDANGDGTVNIADAVGQLDLFVGTDNTIDCDDALDTNDDGQVNIADPVYFLNYQFTLGPVIPDPFLTCGLDTTEDSLGCNEYTNCP